MADIQSNIDVNIDTSAAVANLRSLQRQISAFYTSLSSAGSAANGSIANMQQNLLNTINATGQFSAQLTKVQSTADSFTSSLEKNKLSLGQYFRYAGGASQTFSRMFKTEADVIDKTARERVKDLQTQYVRLGKNASGAIEAIKIRPLSLDMDHLATRTAMAAQKQQLLNQLLRQGSTQLLNFGKNTQWAGRQLMVGFTIPLSMLGTAAAKTFMDMEKQAIAFKRVYGDAFTATEETAQALQSIRDLATEFTKYGVAAEQTMELAARAAAAGKVGAELTAQVREANRLAVLGQVEQSQALETTMSISNAFGTATVDLTKKINFLNAVENQTVTSIEDLTIAVPKAGPVIKQLGGDVEDLAFFLTAMKEGGINASEGANALKSGLASLINPTEKSSAFLKGFGINVQGIVDANKGDVKGIVIDFAKALDTLDPLNRARAIEQMFGKFQFARLSTLFQNVIADGNQASKVLELTAMSASDLAALASKELGTIAASAMFKFQKSVENLRVQLAPLGETFLKIVTPVIEGISNILANFNKLDDRVKTFITGLVLVVGGLGPVLLMTFGLIANGVANIIKGFALVRNLFNKTGDSSRFLGEQTDYMTQQQLEASAAASSLEQVHQKLEQRFTSEAIAINKLTAALQKAVTTQNAYKGTNTGRVAAVKKFADGGMVRGPGGPKDDLIPADLSNGEAVIDAETVRKNPRIIQALFAKKKIVIPGYRNNNSKDMMTQRRARNSTLAESGSLVELWGVTPQLSHASPKFAQGSPQFLEVEAKMGPLPPEYRQFMSVVSNLVVELPLAFNQVMKPNKGGVSSQRFLDVYNSRENKLQIAGILGGLDKDDEEVNVAMRKLEKEIGRRTKEIADATNDGMVTDVELEKATREVIDAKKKRAGAEGRAAKALDAASRQPGQRRIYVPKAKIDEGLATGELKATSQPNRRDRVIQTVGPMPTNLGLFVGEGSKREGDYRPIEGKNMPGSYRGAKSKYGSLSTPTGSEEPKTTRSRSSKKTQEDNDVQVKKGTRNMTALNDRLQRLSFGVMALSGVFSMFGDGPMAEISGAIMGVTGAFYALSTVLEVFRGINLVAIAQKRLEIGMNAGRAATSGITTALDAAGTAALIRGGGPVAGKAGGIFSRFAGFMSKIVPTLGRFGAGLFGVTRGVMAFLGPVGLAAAALTSLAGIALFFIGQEQKRQEKIKGFVDAVTISTEKLSSWTDMLGLEGTPTALQSAIAGATVTAENKTVTSQAINFSQDETFKNNFSDQIKQMEAATKSQAMAILSTVSTTLAAQGATSEQIDSVIQGIQLAAKNKNVKIEFASIDFATKKGRQGVIDSVNTIINDFAKEASKPGITEKVFTDNFTKVINRPTEEFLGRTNEAMKTVQTSLDNLATMANQGLLSGSEFNSMWGKVTNTLKNSSGGIILVNANLKDMAQKFRDAGKADLAAQLDLTADSTLGLSDRMFVTQLAMTGVINNAADLAQVLKDLEIVANANAEFSPTAIVAASIRIEKYKKQVTDATDAYKKYLDGLNSGNNAQNKEKSIYQQTTESLKNKIKEISNANDAYKKLMIAGVDSATAVEIANDSMFAAAIAKTNVNSAAFKTLIALINQYKAAVKTGMPQEDNTRMTGTVDKILDMLNNRKNVVELEFKVNTEKLERDVRLAQEEIDKLQFQIDDYEAGLTRLEDREQDINQTYDKRLEALDKIEAANQRISDQKNSELSISQALARGDVGAAALAIQEEQQRQAQEAFTLQRESLEKQRTAELDGLSVSVMVDGKKVQMSRIDIEKKLKDIKQQIFNIEEDRIEIANEEIRKLDVIKNAEIDRINNFKNLSTAAWEAIKARIDQTKTSSADYLADIEKGLGLLQQYKEYWQGLGIPEGGGLQNPVTTTGGGRGGGGRYAVAYSMYAKGGIVKPSYFDKGGFARGTDTVPAMLTPGEFIMSKYAVDSYGVNTMKAINSGELSGGSVYNSYSVNVNVRSDANPDQIARAVMGQIRQVNSQQLRGNRF
jgi:TP901 family phage tail tape measure protein